MRKWLLSASIAFLNLTLFSNVSAQSNQTIKSGTPTSPVNFPGTKCTYNWINDHPEIGLAASGAGDIASFTGLNTTNVSITARITAVPEPQDLVYVNNLPDHSISVVNSATGKIIAAIPVGTNSFAMTLSPDGSRVYVTSSFENTITVINTATHKAIAKIPVNNPNGITTSPDGSRIYVTDTTHNTILVIYRIYCCFISCRRQLPIR